MNNKENYPIKEIMKEVSWSLIIRTIFFIFAWIVLLNFIAYQYLQRNSSNLGYRVNAKKWKILNDMNEKKNWLVLGDSTCNQGLSINVFEKKLNTEAINLCTIGNMLAVNDSWMLEEYIKKFGPPENILIIHAYDIWQRNDVNVGLASQLPFDFLIKESPEPKIFDKKDKIILLLHKYWPLYYQKESLAESLDRFFWKKNYEETFFNEDGFMTVKNINPEAVNKNTNNHKKYVKNSQFSISPNNLRSMNNIKRLAENYKFNVFIANSPIHDGLFEDNNFKSYINNADIFFSNYSAESKRIFYIKKRYSFSENEMTSSDHVVLNAAEDYTEKLTTDIKDILSNRSFVKLN